MRVTLDLPDELYVVSMTLVAPRLPDGSVHTFVHSFTAKDNKTVRVIRGEKDGIRHYHAEEDDDGGVCR